MPSYEERYEAASDFKLDAHEEGYHDAAIEFGKVLRELILPPINKIRTILNRDIGRNMSYNEGSSDFYNPILAGMQIQQIQDEIEKLYKIVKEAETK